MKTFIFGIPKTTDGQIIKKGKKEKPRGFLSAGLVVYSHLYALHLEGNASIHGIGMNRIKMSVFRKSCI